MAAAKLLGRALFRRAQVGVVLERAGTADQYEPDAIRAVSGSTIVTVVGRPSELMLFANGRGAAAECSWSVSRRRWICCTAPT